MSQNRNERWAFAQERVIKRAALLFDKIDGPCTDGEIPNEIHLRLPNIIFRRTENKENSFFDKAGQDLINKISKERKDLEINRLTTSEIVSLLSEYQTKVFTLAINYAGFAVTPVYDNKQKFLIDFPKGPEMAIQAVIENIPDIIESQTSWNQIIEFRRDEEALRKFRSLRLWLMAGLSANSINHASEIISKKIDDYEWALKKHGLKTTIGYFNILSNWKDIISIAGSSGLAGLVAGPIWSAITAGLHVGSLITVQVIESKIEKQDLANRDFSEVAILYDIKHNLLKKK